MGKYFVDQFPRLDIKKVPRVEKPEKGHISGGLIPVMEYELDRYNMNIEGDVIGIDEQPTGYGVKRFFLCPCCGMRRDYIYYYDRRWKCRECADLRYRSTNEYKDGMQPFERKIKGICDKLQVEDFIKYLPVEHGVPDKPRGMRWSTYAHLIRQLREYQQGRWNAFMNDLKTSGFNFK